MIDHLTVGISDFDRSSVFYDRAFFPLGVSRLVMVPPQSTSGVVVAGYGDTRPYFWIVEADRVMGQLHVALEAKTHAEVDAFYAAAMSAGGRDNGPPGLRPQYDDNYYGAFVLDPDGHNIEAVCRAAT